MSLVGPRPGAAGVRRGPDARHPVLRPAPRRPARPHRMGAGPLHLRRQRRRRDGEAAVRPLLHQEPVASRSTSSSCFDTIKTVILRRGAVTMTPERGAGRRGRQRDDHRRGGLLPRQRRSTASSRGVSGTTSRAASARNTERLLGDPRPSRRPRDVLRARLGGRAVSRRWCGVSPARGHEIASHGYAHRLVYDQTPEAFRDDVRRAKDALEDATGVPRVRLPGAELFDYGAVALGARYPDRGRLPLRREHLPDPSRSLRHSRLGPRHPYVAHARRRVAGRSAGVDGAGAPE